MTLIIQDQFKDIIDVQATAPSSMKTVYTPSQWKTLIEQIRGMLYANKNPYISFDYKPMGPKSNLIEKCNGYITKQNVKYLPKMLVKAWSDIRLYDLLEEIIEHKK